MSTVEVTGPGLITISAPGCRLVIRSGRVVVEGRCIWHSPGADFVFERAPDRWARFLPASWHRPPIVRELPQCAPRREAAT